MGIEQYYVRRCVEELRRDGSVVARLAGVGEAQEVGAEMRRACRAAGLRVRTGVSGEGAVAWAYHMDHVVTPASSRAANRAIASAFDGEMTAPFHELVRQEQRKMLRVVPPPTAEG